MRIRVKFLLHNVFGISYDLYVTEVSDDYSVLDLIKKLGYELGSEVLLNSVSNGGKGLLIMINDIVANDMDKPLTSYAGCNNELNVTIAPLLEGG